MNGTPRRGPGGFPGTPQTNRKADSPNNASTSTSTPSRPNVRTPLPDVPKAPQQASAGPLIPTDILNAASQRAYLFAFYLLLVGWKLYDFYVLAVEDDKSLVSCLKWCFLDMVFIFGVPLLEIPWLEWSNATAFMLFVLHAGLDVMLMFRIGVPLQAWAFSMVAFLYDKELAISERSVKPGPILHNASLILGKQIINILPEGSAILNPDKLAFCLNSTVTQVEIPILINQTEPIEIEFLRIDIETNQNETIVLKGRELKSLLKKARKSAKNMDPTDPLLIRHTAKKTGIYLLKKVLDHSKLEVRPRLSNMVVATCPSASVKPTGDNRCRNDLSDVSLEVRGIPPLSIKYRLTVNGKSKEASEFQSLQPDDYVSPLSRHTSQALVRSGREDVSWAKAQTIKVALNETLTNAGVWKYEVEEVTDALGNFVSYISHDDEEQPKAKGYLGLQQSFIVHERPKAELAGCNPQHPLRIPKGDVTRLPVKYGSTGGSAITAPHTIEYLFTPEADLLVDGYHGPNAVLQAQELKSIREQPKISESGLYTLKSVSTQFCKGEVLEPASCLLQNPPVPELSISKEDIVDKCAGNPIGLRVALDLIGSPPFYIKYTKQRDSRTPVTDVIQIATLRSSIDLTPEHAGHHVYTFRSIRDSIYTDERPLRDLTLSQSVRPPASAKFVDARRPQQACIDDSVEFDVELRGERPWTLEYELVHNGKRKKHSVDINEAVYTIKTEKLVSGGEYTISLASVTDKSKCKMPLEQQAKVNVRHERPKAYFGHIEGKQAVLALEGRSVELPLRLTGTPPWRLEYKNLDTEDVQRISVKNANDNLGVKSQGTYQLIAVRDSVCPGFIDEKASRFAVDWVPRPKLTIPTSESMVLEGSHYVKEAVCEGDEDTFDVALTGNAPYEVAYEELTKDRRGGNSAKSNKHLRAPGGTASVRAQTAKAGTYEYKFVEISDSKYNHDKKHFTPITVQQTVNPRPSAKFNTPGKTYSYCSRESDGEEVIPMTFEGVPPFYLEVEIKHFGTPKPEISIHKNIPTPKYDLTIEHRKLHLGHSAISIRKIRDARGCTLKPPPGSPRVQISVHDAPSATPLEDRTDFCVGERLSFALGGQVPFTIYYNFEGQERKASNAGTTFRRLAELPGTFTITGLRDSASECLASLNLVKEIHPIPSVRLSGGQVSEVDIHEGGGTDLEFTFTGTPPFEFTYTRSTNAVRGKKSKVLEIRTEVSHEMSLAIPVQEEGTYEVVSIKDRWCSFAKSMEGVEVQGQKKLLTY